MTKNWFRYGTIRMTIKHVQWRSGRANYRRRIPEDLQAYYQGKEFHFESLKTKDPAEAARKAQQTTKKLDREWSLLRSSDGGELALREEAMAILREHGLKPGQSAEYDRHDIEPERFVHKLLLESLDQDGQAPGIVPERLPPALRKAAELFYADPEELRDLTVPYFSEVKAEHLYFHPKRENDSQFGRSVERFIEINGELPINE